MTEGGIRLVTQGDDSGSCHSANTAILAAFHKGIMRNTSMLVVGPAFEGAVEMLGNVPGLCVGLHAAVTCEWAEVRWGPVLGPERVPSLVDERGHFFHTTQELHHRGPDPDEMVAEVRAQLDLARSRGANVEYIDDHMGYEWVRDVGDRIARVADEEGVVHIGAPLPHLPAVAGAFDNMVDELLAQLAAAPPGDYFLPGHPCYPTDDVDGLNLPCEAPGVQTELRDWERRIFMDDVVVDHCARHGIEPIRWTDL